MCQENSPSIAEEIVSYISKRLTMPVDSLIGLWLSTYDNVVKHYNNGKSDNIEEYSLISNSYIVISDLGEYGTLFAFKNIVK